MFDRLRDHRLLKLLVFEEGEDLKRAMCAAAARELHTRHERDDCAAIEATVAVELGLDPALVIVRVDNPNHALDHSTGTALADDDINLLKPTGETEPLYDQSEIFSATPSRRWLRRLLVYGPVGMKEYPTLAGRAREAALRALCDYVAGGTPS